METGRYSIREANVFDSHEMAEIENRCFSDPWPEYTFGAELMFDDNVYLILEDSDAPIGFAGIRFISGEAHIMNICVLPEYRGKGLGEKLFTVLMDAGREKATEGYTLEVRVSNSPAIALYEKYGFKNYGRRKHYYDDGEDAYIYWKKD